MASLRQLFRDPKTRLWTLTGILWALALVVVVLAREVLLPFLLAALAAYVIDPVIVRLSRLELRGRRVSRARRRSSRSTWRWGSGSGSSASRSSPGVPRGAARPGRGARVPRRGDAGADRRAGRAPSTRGLQRFGVPVDVLPGEGAGGAAFHVDLAAVIADGLNDANAWLRGSMKDVMAFSRGLIAGTVRTLVFFLLFFMLTAFMSMDAPRIVGLLRVAGPEVLAGRLRPAAGRRRRRARRASCAARSRSWGSTGS